MGKKGVVRDPEVHREVLESFLATAGEIGFNVRNLSFSPVKGPEGNIEFLGHLCKGPVDPPFEADPASLVAAAHEALDN